MDFPEPSLGNAAQATAPSSNGADVGAEPTRATAQPPFYTPANLAPEYSVGYLLRSVLSSIRCAADAQLQGRGLTFAQCLPLYKISHCKDTTLAALARDLEADPATVTRLLDRLEAKELVVRERSTSDRRVVHVRATPLGAAMAQELTPVLADTLNAHLDGFSTDEWQHLLALLRRMLANGDALRHPSIPS
ncbi:MAG: MarR family transcriptional regulator [Simplicispira suum]|uniref:MarR family winged helix-turn-helix transcriptional regulator n=1 Tax=Simplicispira suum TaxID=2109915 RepID=UPI001C6A9D44|nr:MarR family transcriptional regulator [Simplicispira suum]MBW7833537.1 MarR family transcriptional regulator [Simplicispira suum]